jgi:hypothetical protein
LLYTDGDLAIALQLVGRSPVDSVVLEVFRTPRDGRVHRFHTDIRDLTATAPQI